MERPFPLVPVRIAGTQDSAVLYSAAGRDALAGDVLAAKETSLISVFGVSNLLFFAWGWATTTGTPVNIADKTFKLSVVGWPQRSFRAQPVQTTAEPYKLGSPYGRLLWQGTLTFGTTKVGQPSPVAGWHPFLGSNPGEARDYYAVDTIAVDTGFDAVPKKRCNYEVFDAGGDNEVASLELDVQNVAELYAYLTSVDVALTGATKYGIEVAMQRTE